MEALLCGCKKEKSKLDHEFNQDQVLALRLGWERFDLTVLVVFP
jgi:hypothetical protein